MGIIRRRLGSYLPKVMEQVRPLLMPPPQVPRPEMTSVRAQRQDPGGLAGALGLHWPAPRGAAVTWLRCQAGERPPLQPWHCCPLQTPGLSRCQLLSGLSCAQAAGGQPVRGPCPPSPLGTPLIRRNACVCAFYSFKGKKLSLGRILPQTLLLATGWDPGKWGLGRDPHPAVFPRCSWKPQVPSEASPCLGRM